MKRETLVDLIRHGEPVGGRRYRGNGADDPLSPLGWRQMNQALGDACPWQQVISSPMARCRDFAVDLAGRHGLPLAVEPLLMEIGMGSWEGCTHEEVAARHPLDYANLHLDPVRHRPPGGESLADFSARIITAYERQVASYPGRRLLIVCHAGVMRALVGHVLGADPGRWYRVRIDFAGLMRIRHAHPVPVLEWLNAAHVA